MMRAFIAKTDSHRRGGPYSRRMGVSGGGGLGGFLKNKRIPLIFRMVLLSGVCHNVMPFVETLRVLTFGDFTVRYAWYLQGDSSLFKETDSGIYFQLKISWRLLITYGIHRTQ